MHPPYWPLHSPQESGVPVPHIGIYAFAAMLATGNHRSLIRRDISQLPLTGTVGSRPSNELKPKLLFIEAHHHTYVFLFLKAWLKPLNWKLFFLVRFRHAKYDYSQTVEILITLSDSSEHLRGMLFKPYTRLKTHKYTSHVNIVTLISITDTHEISKIKILNLKLEMQLGNKNTTTMKDWGGGGGRNTKIISQWET